MSLYTQELKSHQRAEFCGTKVAGSVPTTFIAELFAAMAKALLTWHVTLELSHFQVLNDVPADGGRAVLYWSGVVPSK